MCHEQTFTGHDSVAGILKTRIFHRGVVCGCPPFIISTTLKFLTDIIMHTPTGLACHITLILHPLALIRKPKSPVFCRLTIQGFGTGSEARKIPTSVSSEGLPISW